MRNNRTREQRQLAALRGKMNRHSGTSWGATINFIGTSGPGVRHRTCQWIDGDPLVDATMCGKPTVHDDRGRLRPYCADHESLVWSTKDGKPIPGRATPFSKDQIKKVKPGLRDGHR